MKILTFYLEKVRVTFHCEILRAFLRLLGSPPIACQVETRGFGGPT